MAAASLANLPICTVDGSPVSAVTLADIESDKMFPLADDEPIQAETTTFIGPGTLHWVQCVEREIGELTEKRLQFSPTEIATSAVDACILEADDYRDFVVKVIGDPNSPQIDGAFERTRTKMVRFYSAIEVARRAGYSSNAMPAAQRP